MKIRGLLRASLNGGQPVSYSQLCKSAETRKWEDWFLFHLKVEGLPPPTSQYRFCDTRKWSCDFAWPDQKIIVEIEGGIWRRNAFGNWAGAHTHPTAVLRDIEKYNHMALMGFRLFRFAPDHLKNGTAIEIMKQVLKT